MELTSLGDDRKTSVPFHFDCKDSTLAAWKGPICTFTLTSIQTVIHYITYCTECRLVTENIQSVLYRRYAVHLSKSRNQHQREVK